MEPILQDDARTPTWSSHALLRLVLVLGGALLTLVVSASSAWGTTQPAWGQVPPQGNDPAPTWTWSSPDAVRYSCTFTYVPTGALVDPGSVCGTSYTASMAGRPTGLYELRVVAYDGADVASSPAVSTLNYTGTSAPVITSEPPPRGSAKTVAWSFTFAAGNTPECTLTRGGTLLETRPSCASPATFTLPSVDGTYTFGVKTNNSPTNTDTYVLDTTGPVVTVTGTARGTDTTPDFTLGGGEAGASYTCTLTAPGGATSPVTPCAPGTVTPTLSGPDGTWTLSAFAKDDLGNQGATASRAYVLDTTGPVVTLTGPTAPSNDLTPTFTLGGGEAGASYTCTLKAPDGTTSTVACAPGSVTPTLTPQQGTWTLSAYATDDLSTPGATVSWDYVLDTIGPAAPGVSGPAGPSKARNPSFSLTGDAAATWSCTVTGPVASAPTCGPGTLTLDLPGADGTYTLTVRLSDGAGNAASTVVTYILDTTAYAAPGVSGPTGPSTDRAPAYTLTGDSAATWTCSLAGPGGTTNPTCGAGTLTLSIPGADGSYLLTVTLSDAAGNTSSTSLTYVLDTRALAAPTVTGPTGPSNDRAPVFTLSASETGVTWSCIVTGPAGTFSVSCSAGTWIYDLSTAVDGTYTASITVRKNGRTSPATIASYTLDTTAPGAPSLSGPAGPSNDRSPVFTVTGEAGATYQCSLSGPDGTTTPACSGGSVTLSLAGSDGLYTLTVTQTDAAGNPGGSISRTYLLDTTPYAAPGVTGPAGPSSDRAPQFTLTGDAGATWTCSVSGPVASSPLCGPGTLTLDLPGADGLYTLTVTLTDAAGNSSSTSRTFLLDTTAYAAPGVSGPAGPSNDRTPSFTLTGDAGATWSCAVTGPVSSTPLCGPGTLTLDLPGADGLYTLTVTLTDVAGNSSSTSRTFLLDTTPYAAPGVTGPAGPSNDRTPSFTLTGDAGATWTCAVAGPVSSAPLCGPGTLTLDLPGADGLYTLTVTLTDAAGNASSTSRTFLLDTTPYAAPGVTGPAGPSNDRSPQFTLTGDAAATWTCSVTGPVASAPLCSPGTLALSLPGADGLYTLTVTLTDAAGNASSTSVTFLLDTTAYAAPGVTGPAGPSNDRSPSSTLTGDAGATWTCAVTGPVSSSPVCGPGTLTLDLPGADGLYTLTVTLTDAAGNASSTSRTFLLDTTPYAAPGVTGPAGPSNDRTPSFTLTGDAGATWSCAVTGPVSSTPLCGPGTLTLNLPGADGLYTLTVTLTDAAGNSSSTSRTFLLDTTAYAAPGVTGPAGPSNDRSPQFTLTGDAAATWTCSVTGPVASSPLCGPGTLTLNLPGADGLYTLTVTLTDAAGNASSTVRTYRLDTAAPAAPGVTGPAGPSNSRTPSFAFVVEAGSTVTCTLRNPDGGSALVPCGSAGATLSLAGSDGVWSLVVVVTDAAGNTSAATTVTYRLDTTAPTAPGVTGPSGPLNDMTPTFELTGEAGSVWTCRLTAPDGATTTTIACGAGFLELNLSGDGAWALEVTVRDAAGNTSAPTKVTYLLDTAPPPAPTVTGPSGPSNDRHPVYELANGSNTWNCTLTSPSGTTTTIACAAGPLTLDLTGADGTWTLRVSVSSSAGNVSTATVRTYLLDTVAPPAPSVTGPTGPAQDRTPTFAVSGEAGASFACTLTGPAGTSVIACSSGSLTLSLPGADGLYTLTVRTTDAAGNSSSTSRTYLLDTTPYAAPGVSGPAGPSNDRTPSFTLTGDAAATWSCAVTGPVASSPLCGPGTLTLDLPGADGLYTLTVTLTDAAGNASSTSRTFLLDTTPYAAPGVSGPAGPSNDRTPSFTLTGDAGATWSCAVAGPVSSTPLCGPGTLALSLPGADGLYTLTVTLTDAAGNASSTSRTFLLDTTPYAAPGVSGPAGPSNDRTPSFTLTGDAGATWTCSVTGPVSSTPLCGPGTLTLDLPGADGLYTLTVTLTDTAGNTSSTTVTFLLDTTPYAAPGVTGPAGPSNDRTPSFTLTGDAGATWTCAVTGPVSSAPLCGPGTLTLDLPGADGLYTLTVTLTDAAGNASSTSVTFLLDTTAYAAPGVTGPAGPSNDRSPSFTLTGDAGATWTCAVTGPVSSSPVCGAGTLTLDLPGADGLYTLTVTLTDAAGNASSTSRTFLLDTTPYAAPGLSGPAGPSNDRTPSFTLTGDAAATWSCAVTGPVASSPLCGPGTLTLDLPGADGLYTLTVTLTDVAGNSSSTSRTFLLDTTPYAAPGVSGPAGPSNDRSPQFTLTGDAAATWTCSVTGPVSSTPLCGPGTLTLDLPGADGLYTLTVTLTDAAGNSSSTSWTFLLDTTPYAAPGVSGPAGPSNDRSPQFTLTGDAAATWTCAVTGRVSSTPLCGPGTLTLDLPGADGLYTLTVTLTDAAGNSSSTSRTFLLDTTAYAAPGVTGPAGPSNDRSPPFTLTGDAAATWSCAVTGPVSSSPLCGPGMLTLDLPGADGLYTLTVTLTDAAGNSSSTSRTFLLDTTPYAAPGVTGPAGPSNDRSPQFMLTGDAAATWSCALTGPDGTTTPVCGPGTLTMDLPGADGLYTLTATLTDAAGNSSSTSRTFLLDTTAYAAPGVTGPAGPSNDRSPSFTLTGDAGAIWTCSVTGPVSSAPVCGPGTLTMDLPGPDGLYTLTVTLTDAAGNTSSTTVTFLLDTTAYAAPGVSGPAGPSNDRAPQFMLTGDAAATWSCAVTGPDGTTTSVCGPGTLTLDLPGADGLYTQTVTLTDAAGNTSSTTVTFLLDTTAYAAPGVSGPAGPSNDRTPSFTLTGDAAATWTCSVSGPVSSTPLCGPGTLTMDLPGADGLYTLTVTLTDAAGNTSSTTVTFLLDTTPPAAPVVDGPDGSSADLMPVFDLGGEAGGTYACTLTAPDGTTTSVLCEPGALTVPLTAQDGTWTLSVTVTDAAGQTSAPTTWTYELDTTAPVAPAVTAAPVTRDSQVAVVVDAEPGTELTCTLTGPDGTVTPVLCGTGTLTLDLVAGDGTYELTVVAVDAAGNSSQQVTPIVLDTVVPAQPGIQPVAGADGQWVVDSEPGTTLTCTLTGPDGQTTDLPCKDGRPTVDLGSLTPGTWVLRVQATDAAGNTSEIGRTSFEIPAPVTPVVAPEPTPDPAPAPVPEPTPEPTLEPTPAIEETPEAQTPIDIVQKVAEVLVPPGPLAKEVIPHLADLVSQRVTARLGSAANLNTRWRATLRVLQDAASVGGIPLLLLLLVFSFLALQNRIDKNDPKLALAPVFSHQELPFRPLERFAT